jgi:hypothetical protein
MAGYLAADIFLLSAARLGFVGPVIGSDPRYIADAIPVVVIIGALAFLPPATSEQPQEARPATPGDLRLRRVAVPAALFAVGAIVSSALAIPAAQNRGARRYAANLSTELRVYPERSLFDGGVPAAAMLPVFADEWRLSRVVGLSRPTARLDATADALFMADADGWMRPFEFYFPARSVPGSVFQCGHLASPGNTDIALERPVVQKHIVVRVDYFTGQANDGRLIAGAMSAPVQFTSGGVRTVYAVTDGPLQSVRVTTGFPVCVTQVLVGGPAPLPR